MTDHSGVWLAIDTATDLAGVALHDGASVLAETHWTSRRRHSVELAGVIQAMLGREGLAIGELAGIAVAGGPGSYTGLRVGMALAKGLALGRGLPLVAVPTLDILAAPWSAPWLGRGLPLWAVLAAGRGRLVAAAYPPTAWQGESPDASAPPEALIAQPAQSMPSTPPAPPAQSAPSTPRAQVYTLAALLSAVRPPAWVVGEIDPPARTALTAAGLRVLPAAAGRRRAGWLAELGRARAVWLADTACAAADLAGIVPVYAEPAEPAQAAE